MLNLYVYLEYRVQDRCRRKAKSELWLKFLKRVIIYLLKASEHHTIIRRCYSSSSVPPSSVSPSCWRESLTISVDQ